MAGSIGTIQDEQIWFFNQGVRLVLVRESKNSRENDM